MPSSKNKEVKATSSPCRPQADLEVELDAAAKVAAAKQLYASLWAPKLNPLFLDVRGRKENPCPERKVISESTQETVCMAEFSGSQQSKRGRRRN